MPHNQPNRREPSLAEQIKTLGRKLDRVLDLQWLILKLEVIQMALGQDILDAVTEETTLVDSLIALVQGLIDNNTIPAAVGAAILTQVSSTKAKLETAIAANTPPAPPVA